MASSCCWFQFGDREKGLGGEQFYVDGVYEQDLDVWVMH